MERKQNKNIRKNKARKNGTPGIAQYSRIKDLGDTLHRNRGIL